MELNVACPGSGKEESCRKDTRPKALSLHVFAFLIDQFQPQLNLPRRCRRRRDQSSRRTYLCAREYNWVRDSQIRVVQGVEKFGSELEVEAFGHGGVFDDREVDLCQTWPAQCSPS